jgi:hypothetical protein
MKGYKVFNPDWTCRGYQYKVGATHETTTKIELCEKGFHFCEKLTDCFYYYSFDFRNKVAEVEALGEIIKSKEDSKCVTNKLKVVREIPWLEVLKLSNIGNNNIGYKNTGDYNIGAHNTGSYNIGDNNSGSYNYGRSNSGNDNIGFFNTGNTNLGNFNAGTLNCGSSNIGDFNIGNHNMGMGNNGDYNIGDFNITNNSFGVFCTQPNVSSPDGKIKIFDKPSDLTLEAWRSSEARKILSTAFNYAYMNIDPLLHDAIKSIVLIEIDKKLDEIKTMSSTNWGLYVENDLFTDSTVDFCYIKLANHKLIFTDWWKTLSNDKQEIIKSIPNFNPEIFQLITGIDVTKEELK